MSEYDKYSKRVLIIGAGIAGMQAALDIAGLGEKPKYPIPDTQYLPRSSS